MLCAICYGYGPIKLNQKHLIIEMSSIHYKNYNNVLTQKPEHYIRTALDSFLTAELPDSVLSTLIHLSIGLELFLKRNLTKVDPNLTKRNIPRNQFIRLEKKTKLLESTIERRNFFIDEIAKFEVKDDHTINFYQAIEISRFIMDYQTGFLDNIHSLRNVRNGIFHSDLSQLENHSLSQLCLKLFQYIYLFYQDSADHYLTSEITIFDPLYTKIVTLQHLNRFYFNELGFNIQRRINLARERFQIYLDINHYIIDGENRFKSTIIKEPCPVCKFQRLGTYKSDPEIVFRCGVCDFHCTEKELNSIHPDVPDYAQQLYKNANCE